MGVRMRMALAACPSCAEEARGSPVSAKQSVLLVLLLRAASSLQRRT